MIHLLGGRPERPPTPPPLTSLVEMAKGFLVCKGTDLKGGLKTRYQALETRLAMACHAVLPFETLRKNAVAQLLNSRQNSPIRSKNSSLGLRTGPERWMMSCDLVRRCRSEQNAR